MSIEGLQWQTFQIPFGYGMRQDADSRALNPPELTIATDLEFEETGGLQTRKPYEEFGLNILGGGTLEDLRRCERNGSERLVFTKDSLYSWSPAHSAWVLKGTHLAAKLDEESVFATTDDQAGCDRAELDGIVFYSWGTTVGSTYTGYVAARDKETGAVVLEPYELTGFQRIRLVALDTVVLLAFYDGLNGIYCYALDPADPETALGGASTTLSSSGVSSSAGPFYDIVKVPLADQAVFVVSEEAAAEYTVGTVTAGLSVARSGKARDSDGPMAVSCEPTGTSVQVVRSVDASQEVFGDLITISTLADVYTDQVIGSFAGSGDISNITAAHRSTQDSGEYRCYVFWAAGETTGAGGEMHYNWVDTGGALGSESTFRHNLALASRAFDHDGHVYVWGVFAGASAVPSPAFGAQLQNTYFLYRDDVHLCAKATPAKAGGLNESGHLPGVTADNGVYSFCGGERRVIQLGSYQSGYADRTPRDITVTFDSDEARRCVRLGGTLYITGGEIRQYDGTQLTEVGFHVFPWFWSLTQPGAGSLPVGTYAYKVTWRWQNARGETERSTTAVIGTITVVVGTKVLVVGGIVPLATTHKADKPISVEVWRTLANPIQESPYYLVSSPDPGDAGLAGNEYIANDIDASNLSAFGDNLTDAVAQGKEPNNENGVVLESVAPPAATIIAASAERVFLAGVAGDPDRVWYSKLRGDNEIVSFNDALTVNIPREGGALTGLAFLNETLIAFRERAIFALAGDGFDNIGGGSNYGPARMLSSDVGAVNQESIALTPMGLVFKSEKGWQLLNRGWAVDYIGGPVKDHDDEDVLAVHVLESQHQVRCMTDSRLLVLDYQAKTQTSPLGQWASWSIPNGVHATLWSGAHVVIADGAIQRQLTDFTGIDYGMDVETAWIKMSDLQGAGRVRRLLVLGEHRGSCNVRVRIARDYQPDYFYDQTFPAAPDTTSDVFDDIGDPLQFKIGPSIQQCQAIKVRITAVLLTWSEEEDPEVDPPTYAGPTTEALKLTGIALECGIRPSLYRNISAAKRV